MTIYIPIWLICILGTAAVIGTVISLYSVGFLIYVICDLLKMDH